MATLGTSALPSEEEKSAHVRRMFSSIAPRYDLLNHLLSLSIDRSWRRRAVDLLGWDERPQGVFLDNCAGTLDLATELANRPGFRGRVVGSDFAFPMLQRGQGKRVALPIDSVCADALRLPYADATFDGVTVGFGVRNLADLDAGLREMARVLKAGARLVVLEFTTPQHGPLRSLYLLYFRRILPLIGRLVSRHDSAYDYLPQSVLAFPDPPDLAERLRNAGFDRVEWKGLTGGVVALHWGVRT